MKRLIRLTENDLKQVIKESVSNILKEFDYNPSASDFDDVPTADEYDNFDKYHKFIKPYKDPYNDIDSYGGSGIIGNDDELNLDLESRKLGKIIKESIKKVLKEMGGEKYLSHDRTITVYKAVSKKHADMAVNGDYSGLFSGVGMTYGKGIYVTFEPKQNKYYDRPGQVWIEMLVPGSALKTIHSKHDGSFGIITNPDDIYEVRYLNGGNEDTIDKFNRDIIICSGSRKQFNYNRIGKGNLYGDGLYLSVGDKIPSHYVNYGDDVIQVYVDASGFAHPKSSMDALKISKSKKFPGMIFTTNHDGKICVVYDRSRIIGKV